MYALSQAKKQTLSEDDYEAIRSPQTLVSEQNTPNDEKGATLKSQTHDYSGERRKRSKKSKKKKKGHQDRHHRSHGNEANERTASKNHNEGQLAVDKIGPVDDDGSRTPSGVPDTGGYAAATIAPNLTSSMDCAAVKERTEARGLTEKYSPAISNPDTPIPARKSRMGVPQGVTVGAIRVAGPRGVDDEEAQANDSIDGFSFENAFSTRNPSETEVTHRGEGPFVATRVSDTEADIEAQVQSRMQKLISGAAVPIEVQPTAEDMPSVQSKDDSQKKKVCLIAIVLLAIVAAIGAGVGVAVAVSKKPPDEPEQVTARAQAFQAFLEPISGEQLKDTTSPQFQALSWLANDDTASMEIGVDSEAAIKTRYVAAVLYYSFRGDTWANKYNFLSEDDVCEWNQRLFDGSTSGIACSSDGTVESFQLPANNLQGSIPRELGYYTDLINLTLSNNFIEGSLAISLANLTRLENLNVTLNAMTGTLPELLFSRQSLTTIDLQHNRFSGTIGDSLGQSDQLRVFWANNNSLTGTIPFAVGQSLALGSLDLTLNQLTGTIPNFLSSSGLWNLHLGNNDLTGTIPTTVGSLSSLVTFDVAGNGKYKRPGISGQIPSELGNCKNLFYLSLDNNTLAESIPSELGSIPSLQYLLAANNGLTGSIPAELGNSTLRGIGLRGNYLSGDIGPVIDSLPRSLQFFHVSVNQLRGTIPTSIDSLSSLTVFAIGNNDMNGTIPSQFGNLVSLEQIWLDDNNFTGALPTSIASLPNIITLGVFGNDLTGTLDEFCTIWDDFPQETKEFAANTCGLSEIECPCCNYCCNIEISNECRQI